MSTNIDIDTILSGKNPNRFRKVLILLIGISLVGAYFTYDYMTSENEEAIFETITTEHIVQKTNLTTTVEAASTIIAEEQLSLSEKISASTVGFPLLSKTWRPLIFLIFAILY